MSANYEGRNGVGDYLLGPRWSPPPEQYVRKKRRADRKLDPDPCFSHIRREGSAALQSCNNREPFCAERQ